MYQRFKDYFGPDFNTQTGAPHQGYGSSTYLGFHGAGSLAIDLPHFRRFEPTQNCTRGFLLMNETLNPRDGVMVYTSPRYDTQEGDRYIRRGDDQWYPGTCEADFFCDTSDGLQSESCAEGYVCEETSNSSEGMWFPCREGYVCDFATTPDVDLLAPASQFTHTVSYTHLTLPTNREV